MFSEQFASGLDESIFTVCLLNVNILNLSLPNGHADATF